jgi:hypothetical protein
MQQNYSDEIGSILYKHKLMLCVCEYGTNGMVSSVLAKVKYNNEVFVGSYVFNNKKMLNEFNVSEDDKYFAMHIGLIALRKTQADICLVTHVYDDKLFLLLIFMGKIFEKQISLAKIKDQVTESSALALVFLSNVLIKGDK